MYLRFEDAYNDYLLYVNLKQKTQSVNSLIQKFKLYILPYFKDFNIYDIKAIDYLKFQDYIEKKNLSYNSKRNIHFLLSGFFNYCINFYNLDKNVVSIVGCFKNKNQRKFKYNFYTIDEFNKFIKYVDNEIYKQFFIFMFFTGTRPGEAMALKFSDITNNYIYINKTIDEHGTREIGTPKSSSSYRNVVIDEHLLNNILLLKHYYEKKYNNKNYDYFIFGGLKPLAPTTINRYKEKACNKAKIKKIRLHDFRHSHATLLIDNNIPIIEISKRLGHSNLSTTMDIYIHNNSENEKRVLSTLNSLYNDYSSHF